MRVALCVLALLAACQSQGEPPAAATPRARPGPARQSDVTAEDYVLPSLPHARVVLTDAYGAPHAVDAEVAATRDARTRGLMWRRSLADGAGMLFIFPQEEPLNFWMKNTLIPLDMIFLAADRTIVGVVERATPLTLTPRGPDADARYVLEVPAGWVARVGLRRGLKVRIDGVEGLAGEP
jgi:uncharacterized membrane protein (UPF0127 family)